jgi:hypothetical protein
MKRLSFFLILISCSLFISGFFRPDNVPPGIAPDAVCLTEGCNMSGSIDMNNNYIYNANFLNATFSGSVNATDVQNPLWLNLTGGTMSGTIDMGGFDIINILNLVAQKIFSNDWSNVTIFESQILDLNHTKAGGEFLYDSDKKIYLNDSKLQQFISTNDSDFCRGGNCSGSLNMSGHDITDINYITFYQSNTSYFIYNQTNQTLDLWVNGQKQQSWGHSTTIYQEATFLANAFFQNIFLQSAAGNELLINTSVTIGENLTVYGYTMGNGTYITDVCHPDGRGCNLNGTFLIGVCLTNGTGCPQQTIQTDNNYLYNNNNTITFSEIKLNQTIYDKIKIHILNTTITVAGGNGYGQTNFTFPNSAEILRVSVFPTTITNQYKFSANTSITGDFIDTDRRTHIGNWKVAHDGSTIENEAINFYITNANIDENFIVEIRYQE